MAKIHPSAVVESGAQLADSVEVGPMCYVGANVKIGAGTRLIAQCHISGYTTIGDNNTFYPFAAVGMPGQDFHADENLVSYIKIGNGNVFREGITVHAGTAEGSTTTIGDNCMLMHSSHVGHNANVGNRVVMVNCSVLGGYAQVADNALLSGLVAVHQFCRVGRFAMLSGGSVFSKDIPPFMMAEGRNGGLKMVNVVGLKRAGFSDETIRTIRNIYKIFCTSGLSQSNAIAQIKEELPQIPEVLEFIEFYESSQRGVLGARSDGHRN